LTHTKKHLLALASIILLAILAYWQVAFNQYILTHDFINCWLPWRYYLSQCIQNGTFPFWNPYQQLGYPIHADLQGPVWYFESWLLSMVSEQNPIVLQYLFVGYIALSGMGMYGLSYYLNGNKKAAWSVGVAYMLGGFFVAHSQHFYSIISAAWLPFIVLNFLKLMQLRQLKYGLYTSVFLFFTLTGGNHTFAFFTAYLLVTLAVYFLYQSYKTNMANFWTQTKYLTITLVLTILQVIMVLVVYVQVQPYIDRLSGLNYESCIANSFSWQAMISFLHPFATTVEWEYFNTDPSMSNHYFGILLLPFCVLFLFKKNTALEKILAVFAVFCLILSLGDATPLYKIMYQYLPGINLFRFISYFSFMFTFCMLLLAGNTISYFSSNYQAHKNILISIFFAFSGIVLVVFIYSVTKGRFISFANYFLSHSLFERSIFGNRYDHMAFQGFIQLFFLLILGLVYWKKVHWTSITFMILLSLDLIIAVQLNIGNVCIGNSNPKQLNAYINSLPRKFNCPPDEPIANFNEERGQKFGLYRNTACFHHWISDSYHNSFVFTGKTNLYFEHHQVHEAMLKNNLFYVSNALYPMAKLKAQIASDQLQRKVFLEEKSLKELSQDIDISDSILNAQVILQEVNPNNMQANVSCNQKIMLHCMQSYYKGWKALIDSHETKIYKSNGLIMSIAVPQGKHQINFIYQNDTALFAGIAGYTVFFIIMIYISIYNRNHYFYKYGFAFFWLSILVITIKYFAF
jgi:hypothetical protein